MGTKNVTREQLTKAAKKISPQEGELCPQFISETSLWKIAIENAFLNELTGEDVETLRDGYKKFQRDGIII